MEKLILNNYGSFDIVFSKGKGSVLWDINNKKYIDFVSGIGVNCLGHNYKPLVKAISKQAKKELHISNYYFSDIGLEYAKKLMETSGFQKGYFANSGAEANEAAIKLARKYGQLNGGEKRKTIVTLEASFHGRTLATLKATGQEKFHVDDFAPYPEGFKSIKANDYEAIKSAFDDTCAAFFVECIQGEGGVNPLDAQWLSAAAKAAREAGAIVMADEVQTGFSRTGSFLASDTLGFNPEVVTLAKGIAGGLPMGACLFRGKAADVFQAGDHQSTFAGNPLVCAAANLVLETVREESFLNRVNHAGDYIRGAISSWNIPFIRDIRGKGLMIGIQIDKSISPLDVKLKCLEKGLCITTAGSDVLRFLPPLNISDKEINEGLEIFKKVLLLYK